MNNPVPRKDRMLLLHQLLDTFFETIGKNESGISTLLGQLRDLRKEYATLLKNDLIVGLLQTQGDGTISDNISRERLAMLLEKLIASFRADQEKSYQFLEQDLRKYILETLGQKHLLAGLKELSEARKHLDDAERENKEFSLKIHQLQHDQKEMILENSELKEERDYLKRKLEMLLKQNRSLSDAKEASEDYQRLIRKIRKALEDVKTEDIWRMKVFYNRVAAMTHSTWSYAGVPKTEPFKAKSKQVQKFLESL